MNVSNAHAGSLLRLLGFHPGELAGQADAQNMLGRVLLAQALADGATTVTARYGTGATIVGERPSAPALAGLRGLCDWAATAGLIISWA